MTERTALWEPPPRPEWVQRINEEGAHMNISAVVPLDPESLISAAQRSTGLTDFGDDNWREPFEILCKAMEEEADLNLMGRIRTRSEILQLLEGRLQIEDWYTPPPGDRRRGRQRTHLRDRAGPFGNHDASQHPGCSPRQLRAKTLGDHLSPARRRRRPPTRPIPGSSAVIN
ncbi:hypothetical protein IWGMT90018_44660 [Mycobacterium kiyosense]|nr:hypothetical protein IWGMT90018_44660 [Mycobacterium kiyosense]